MPPIDNIKNRSITKQKPKNNSKFQNNQAFSKMQIDDKNTTIYNKSQQSAHLQKNTSQLTENDTLQNTTKSPYLPSPLKRPATPINKKTKKQNTHRNWNSDTENEDEKEEIQNHTNSRNYQPLQTTLPNETTRFNHFSGAFPPPTG